MRQIAAAPVLAVLASASGCTSGEEPIDLATCSEPDVFRIDQLELPGSVAQARTLGQDLDGDAEIDNHIGMLLSTFHGQFQPLDLTAVANGRLAGEVAWQLALRTCGDRVAVSLASAERLDEAHLVGPAAAGGSGPLVVHGAGAEVPLSLMFDPLAAVTSPGWLAGSLGSLELAVSADGTRVSARLGAAVDPDAAFDVVVPPLARFLDQVRGTNPDLSAYFDRDGDGRVTDADLRASEFLRTLAGPDLDVEDARVMSLGIAFSGAREP